MADKKSKGASRVPDPAAQPAGPSLGQMITEARERKGLTREQVVTDAHLPAHYVKMIESDSYGLISDQLYLLPFLRRYATFLGLDAEEVASRFVRDVQRAEGNVVRISQEITMVVKRKGVGRNIVFAMLIVAIVVLLGDFAWRRFVERESLAPAPAPSPAAANPPAAAASPAASIVPIAPAAAISPAAKASTAEVLDDPLPPVTIVTNPDASAPRPSRATPPNVPRRPDAARRSAPPRDD